MTSRLGTAPRLILTRTPVRISMGAGATDLPPYYERRGAGFVTAAGSRYVYVMVHHHPEKVVWMGMNLAQRVDSPERLDHPVVREALKLMDLRKNIEVVSVSDVRLGSGMGASSSFIVGLLKALHAYKGEYPWPEELAKEACYVERTLLSESGGKQDQYAASLGGFIWMQISTKGEVEVSRLGLRPEFVSQLNRCIAFFHIGQERDSTKIQRGYEDLVTERTDIMEKLDRTRDLASQIRRALLAEDIVELGRLLDRHWQLKRQISPFVSTKEIDKAYRLGLRSGAIGANLMGAGGGGYLMLVCKDERAMKSVQHRMTSEGIDLIELGFEPRGSSLLEV